MLARHRPVYNKTHLALQFTHLRVSNKQWQIHGLLNEIINFVEHIEKISRFNICIVAAYIFLVIVMNSC